MSTPSDSIFIYCDDPAHSQPIAVTNFHPIMTGDRRWEEKYTSTAAQGSRESGTTLIDDQPPKPGEIPLLEDVIDEGGDVRSRYRLECRKCRGRTAVVLRAANLFKVLNTLAEHGVSRISLTGFAASLRSIST